MQIYAICDDADDSLEFASIEHALETNELCNFKLMNAIHSTAVFRADNHSAIYGR